MKSAGVKAFFVLMMSSALTAKAANRFWVAAGPSNWNNTANWSNASGGAGGFSVPGVGDNATFDGNGLGNCTIDLTLSLATITVNAAYTGTISQGANTVTTTGTATFGGGTFTGGSANITFGGTFTLSGTAVFTSTTALLEFQGNCAFTAGTFNHNNGSVRYNRAAATTISGGAETFYNLEFVGNGFAVSITAGAMTVANTLTISGTSFLTLNTGTINADGDITITNSATGGGGSALVNIAGAGTQNFTGGAAVGDGALPQVTINKPSGTLNLLNFPSIANNFTYTAGTVSAGTSTLCFSKAAANYTLTGSLTINNLSFTAGANFTATIAAGTTITCTGDLTIAGSANMTLNTGTINVAGNLILTNTGAGGGGSATINLDGAANQNIDGSAIAGNQSLLPNLTLNSTSTISLLGNISLAGNLTYTSGTVTPGTATVFVANSLTVTGSFALYNLTLNRGANQTLTVAVGSTVTVDNIFDMENGAFNVTVNTGTIAVQGNITDNNTGLAGGGTGTILINGTGAQTITSAGVLDEGRFPAVTINKASGTLQFPSLITVVGNWTYTAGTLDVTTNNSTVVFRATLTISGTHTLNHVEFAANANHTYSFSNGTVLTVTGTLTTADVSNVTINAVVAGTTVMQAQGNIQINNTGAGGGGTGGILINGTGAQSLTSTAASGHGRMPYITIQKASGTLTFSGIISESRTWTYTSGTVDATTNATTVVFGGNNLSIASAGMSFYNVTVTANTSTLTNAMTVNNALTITGGVLAPGANTINLAGNWSDYGTAGFTEATSTVNFDGASLQTITTAGGENFTNMTVNNTRAGIQLQNNVTSATTLTMTLGNIDLNGNTLTLGLSAAATGTLAYTAGNMINTGSFTRWLAVGTIAAGSANGLFPMGTATDTRPIYLSAPAAGPTTGGTVTVAYTDATTNTAVSISDPPNTIVLRKDLNWAMSTANGLAGGTYNLQEQGTGYGVIGAVSDLRVSLLNSVVGAAGVNGGTTADPQVNRTGLAVTDLTNTFYLGSINSASSPLPVKLIRFTAAAEGSTVRLDWETAMETASDYFTVLRSRDAVQWDSVTVVPGHGNSDGPAYYETSDNHPYHGVSYYRLAQTDDNGKVTYSEVCVINVGEGAGDLVVYPNPADDHIVVVPSVAGSNLTVQIVDIRGMIVVQPVCSNGGSVVMSVRGLASGVYFLRIQQASGTQVTPILVKR